MEIHFDQKKLNQLAQKYHLRFVILYGSQATGKTRSDSDIDLGILGLRKFDYQTYLNLLRDLSEIFGNSQNQELDVANLYRADPLFKYEVVKSGLLLYGDKANYEEYKASTYYAFEDAKPLFKLERILVKKFQNHLNNLQFKGQNA